MTMPLKSLTAMYKILPASSITDLIAFTGVSGRTMPAESSGARGSRAHTAVPFGVTATWGSWPSGTPIGAQGTPKRQRFLFATGATTRSQTPPPHPPNPLGTRTPLHEYQTWHKTNKTGLPFKAAKMTRDVIGHVILPCFKASLTI